MSGAFILARGRESAESRMTETVSGGVWGDGTDPVTLEPTRVLVEEHYAGRGRVKYPSLSVSDVSESSQPVGVQEPYLSVPTGSTALVEGDEVAVTASTADGSLVGRRYTVMGAPQAGQTTSLRYPLKELS